MTLDLSCALTRFPPSTVTALHCHQLFPEQYDILLVKSMVRLISGYKN